jgi:predicted NBD/HSP70 family sugar kinase
VNPHPSELWPVLHEGQRRVLRELIIHGGQSRVDMARKLNVSRANLSRLSAELIDVGLVTEGLPLYSPTRGRPAEILHLEPGAAHFVGVKLTGDHLYAVLTDLSARVLDERTRELVSREPADVADLIAEVADDLFVGRKVPAAVGVCLAGNVLERDGERLVEQSHFLGWTSAPLARLVEERMTHRVSVANDVLALTAAHHWFGAGVGHASLVVYGLGAGIGSGVVVFDEVVTGSSGRAGHVGHSRLAATGRQCELGHLDCVHSFVTMGSIAQNAGFGDDYDAALAAARAGEHDAVRAFDLAARALGVVIAEAINTVDPEKVLVAGEGVDMMELSPEGLTAGLADHLEQVDVATVVIERPPFTFSDYARGAAITAMRDLI